MEENEQTKIIEKIKKIAEVSHLSFLFGAGVSSPFISPLPEIEQGMDAAEEQGKAEEATKLKKEFFSKVMIPCLSIKSYTYSADKDDGSKSQLAETYESYRSFLIEITRYLLSRKSTLLDKQVNLFTTAEEEKGPKSETVNLTKPGRKNRPMEYLITLKKN